MHLHDYFFFDLLNRYLIVSFKSKSKFYFDFLPVLTVVGKEQVGM